MLWGNVQLKCEPEKAGLVHDCQFWDPVGLFVMYGDPNLTLYSNGP